MKSGKIWLLVVCVFVILGVTIAVPNTRAQECPGCPGASEGGAYESGNCTCYVWQRASSSAAWGYWFPDALGHAYQWDNEAVKEPYNLFIGTIPYPNAVAVWEGYTYPANTVYGHVAYVTSVSGDAEHTFRVTQMNISGYLGCVFPGEYSAKGMGGNLHFIYPPSPNPVRLWPYEGFRVEYHETVPPGNAILNLEWYGGSGSYDLITEVQRRDGNGNPIGSRELVGEFFNLAATRFNIYQWSWPACPTIPLGSWYWRVKNAGGSSWSPWFSFELTGCQAPCGAAAQGGQDFGSASTTAGLGYCPAIGNPTPIPTSTPFPTPTQAPEPTNTPLPGPGELRQASDLHFSPENPLVGQQVHFWFQVRNGGGEVITFTQIGPYGHGWDANSHGHHALNPGEIRTINTYRYFNEAGIWTVGGIHYQLLDDSEPRGYYNLPRDGYAAAGLGVHVVEPTPEPTYTPGPTQTPVWTPTEVPATSTPVGQTPVPTATPPVGPTPTPCSPLLSVGDFDCNCEITIDDVMEVVSRWRCEEGDACYNEVYDLNHDGVINIVDIMLVSAHWGEMCLATPTPFPTPRPTVTPEPPPTPG